MSENINRSAVLEGMQISMETRIEEARQAMSKELQFTSEQHLSSYEAIMNALRENVDSVLAEIRYLSQQNSSIYEYGQVQQNSVKEEILAAVDAKTQTAMQECTEQIAQVSKTLTEHFEESLKAFDERIAQRLEIFRKEICETLSADAEEEDAAASAEDLKSFSEDVSAQIASLKELIEAGAQSAVEEEEDVAQAETPLSQEQTVSVGPVAEQTYAEDAIDYDVLAEKISTILPETDYDLIADKVASSMPQTDESALADKIVAILPQTDENALAEKLAESVPPTDYDLIAEKVASAIGHEFDITGEGADKIAKSVAAELDYEQIAVRVAELLKAEGIAVAPAPEEAEEQTLRQEQTAAVPVPACPVETREEAVKTAAPAEEEAVTETEEEISAEEAESELAAAQAGAPGDVALYGAAVVLPSAEETELVTRYKRSFVAKIIESDEEIKQYYSSMKNRFLSYAKVSSQVSWSNDRFTYKRETVAKIGIRGKTLCLYLALNPDEFPSTVYHQKFAGDTKMYERTPMLVKIKSGVALKRAIRLIDLLMERNGAVEETREPVDYAAEYAYRTEEQLLAEGLIKTALIEKSDLDF